MINDAEQTYLLKQGKALSSSTTCVRCLLTDALGELAVTSIHLFERRLDTADLVADVGREHVVTCQSPRCQNKAPGGLVDW